MDPDSFVQDLAISTCGGSYLVGGLWIASSYDDGFLGPRAITLS